MKSKQKIGCILLSVIFLLNIFCVPIYATASDDYTKWKQTDNEWNRSQAWTRTEYPNADYYYMRDAGCAVTSIAMLLRHYNVVTDSNVNNFNPWICNEALKAAGAFNTYADIDFTKVSRAYPGFQGGYKETYSLSRLKSRYNNGYACVVRVRNGGSDHYVAVRSINGDTVYIMDPGSTATTLSHYRNILNIIYYTVTASDTTSTGESDKTANGSDKISATNISKPGTITYGKTFSCKGTITSESSKLTDVTATIFKSDGNTKVYSCSVNPNAKTCNLQSTYNGKNIDASMLFNKLSIDTYYYRVTATNAKGTTTIVDSQKFTIKNGITITGATSPGTLSYGRAWSCTGKVKSEYQLTNVTGYILKADNSVAYSKSVNPASKNYTLSGSTIDNRLYFNRLPRGTYYYRIYAKDSSGETLTWTSKAFTVR